MNEELMFSSKKDNWETPQDFYEKLHKEFEFDLDSAASKTNAKCPRFYTKEQNGLAQRWEGKVFCNPPYGRQIGRWVEKSYKEAQKENTTVVMLLPARTDTKWFYNYIYGKAEIRFLKGRLKFGGCKNNAPFPSMVVIYR